MFLDITSSLLILTLFLFASCMCYFVKWWITSKDLAYHKARINTLEDKLLFLEKELANKQQLFDASVIGNIKAKWNTKD